MSNVDYKSNRYAIFCELMETLYESSRIVSSYMRASRKYGTEHDLYMAEAHLLDFIYQGKGCTVTDIAKALNISKSAVTQNLNKLQKKSLIDKKRSEVNYKEFNVSLTDTGKTICLFHENLDKEEYTTKMNRAHEYSDQELKKAIDILKIAAGINTGG